MKIATRKILFRPFLRKMHKNSFPVFDNCNNLFARAFARMRIINFGTNILLIVNIVL